MGVAGRAEGAALCASRRKKKVFPYLLNSYSLPLSIHHGYVAAPFPSLGVCLVNMVPRMNMLTCAAPKKSKMSLGDFLADESM